MHSRNDPHAPPATDPTQAPSERSDADETGAAAATPRLVPVAGFGPPVAAGEVGTLGPYRLVRLLGKGGMGEVYAALDPRLERKIALKVMLPEQAADRGARERFVREARAAAKVTHDHVVTVYEADERDGMPYIAMQFLEGYPLDEYLKKKGNPTIAQVLRIGRETAAGLAAAHRLGLIHRDIKPANLWLEAPQGRVKVLDFGLAKPVDAEVELTKSGAIVGTPAFMSPEQARGEKVDHRTDLFSLGAVLYRLVTGRLPFPGASTMAVLIALGTEDPPPVRSLNPAVPESLAALIHQLLAKSAGDRPASADAVAKRLWVIGQELTAERARALEQSASQPQVIPSRMTNVAIPLTAPADNPFAELGATEADETPEAAPAAVAVTPRRKTWAVAAGLAALVLAAFGGVIIIIRNRDGTETKIEVPDGATVTVKGKDGKTVAQVGPGVKTPADHSADRKAAEYVVSVGGVVRVGGQDRDLKTAADLPNERLILTHVKLYGTNVTEAGLAHLRDCKGLTYLGLGDTGVTDAGLAHFKDCKGLTFLDLNDTGVTDAGLAHFKDCKGLTGLDLRGTKVTDLGLAHFKDCKGLTLLHLYATRTTDAGLVHFKDCKALTLLTLSGTGVTDTGLAHFKDCTGLTYLGLGGTGVTDAGLAHFKDCKGLHSLLLGGTRVTDAGLAHFKDCTGLTYLSLGAGVTDAGLAHFKDCTGLTGLDLRGAKVTAAGLDRFHADVPGCRIEYDGGVFEPWDVDRKAADAVIGLTGYVAVTGKGQFVTGVADLPKEPFQVTEVHLERRAITDDDLVKLKGLKHVTTLTLNFTALSDAGLAHLKGLQSLRTLHIPSTQVSDAGLEHLKGLTNLTGLGIDSTKVADAGLVHLKGLKNLATLGLQNTQVTDAGLVHLKDLKSLTGLGLEKTRVTAKGAADFHAAMPWCEIGHDSGVLKPIDVDRKAAEWVFSAGGKVWINGAKADVTAATGLPKEPFRLTHINLDGVKTVTDADLTRHRGLRNLVYFGASGSPGLTDVGLVHLRDSRGLTGVDVRGTRVTAAGAAALQAAVPGCRVQYEGGVLEPKK